MTDSPRLSPNAQVARMIELLDADDVRAFLEEHAEESISVNFRVNDRRVYPNVLLAVQQAFTGK